MDIPDIENLRRDYTAEALDIPDVDSDPIRQFRHWFTEAVNAAVPEPNAMTLATVTPDGRPAARIVLLKGFDPAGFIFYTNYQGRKGRELDSNPHAALVFLWHELQRQVRIEGVVSKTDPLEATRYFQSRPRGSQIGAWASPQSQVVESRAFLERRVRELERQYEDQDILPKPEHWGGYVVRPERIEFWQGRTSRLHDRILYSRLPGGGWQIERLAP